jgi:hypothetical protein
MAIVVLENLQPSRDIRCVFFASLLVQFEIGARESRLQLLQFGKCPSLAQPSSPQLSRP